MDCDGWEDQASVTRHLQQEDNMDSAFPTPYPELNHVLRELVESVQKTLSENFIGYIQTPGTFSMGKTLE